MKNYIKALLLNISILSICYAAEHTEEEQAYVPPATYTSATPIVRMHESNNRSLTRIREQTREIHSFTRTFEQEDSSAFFESILQQASFREPVIPLERTRLNTSDFNLDIISLATRSLDLNLLVPEVIAYNSPNLIVAAGAPPPPDPLLTLLDTDLLFPTIHRFDGDYFSISITRYLDSLYEIYDWEWYWDSTNYLRRYHLHYSQMTDWLRLHPIRYIPINYNITIYENFIRDLNIDTPTTANPDVTGQEALAHKREQIRNDYIRMATEGPSAEMHTTRHFFKRVVR